MASRLGFAAFRLGKSVQAGVRASAFKGFQRALSTEAPAAEEATAGSGTQWGKVLPLAALMGVVGGTAMYVSLEQSLQKKSDSGDSGSSSPRVSTVGNYDLVRKAIATRLEDSTWDDGSWGPVLVRLAWHASGTYDKKTQTGGSDGATMRFPPESLHGANAGLYHARIFLEPIKSEYPWISYADLWTLAGAVAIEEMGGPSIPWRSGRSDAPDNTTAPPDGRLPDASKTQKHVRDIFGRMGFTDREMVALIGAHALGRCHKDRSGYVGPWTRAPTTFSNDYYKELVNNKWTKKKWDGPLQYEDPTGELMMLPSDMALIWDKKFKEIVTLYAKDEKAFFDDFASAFGKLLELGVKFQ
mmetsp:Transcript_13011/g.21304  ORF Transcript_13011/g.21304 Transcript_13011/m.21304 type:complete len:356 (-) Transcript_13011:415-1482(-)|eukprot:CAMPEP_0184655796 /NCGR_PEP_ID=MMETSP0308-20130426/14428_1 /TAXON_ID=38269 /ORGANISM="Gloeochaete witrockiana, Strain SAG 46.84" /LENGTH=355 /DNA_ID=CAMNT_0027092541 /DNA_START=59 /DNA_END=1126 /DNA_ORIENTATION=+